MHRVRTRRSALLPRLPKCWTNQQSHAAQTRSKTNYCTARSSGQLVHGSRLSVAVDEPATRRSPAPTPPAHQPDPPPTADGRRASTTRPPTPDPDQPPPTTPPPEPDHRRSQRHSAVAAAAQPRGHRTPVRV